jgi:hypothetical protein
LPLRFLGGFFAFFALRSERYLGFIGLRYEREDPNKQTFIQTPDGWPHACPLI